VLKQERELYSKIQLEERIEILVTKPLSCQEIDSDEDFADSY
jgi:hypothetical protein